MAGRGTPRGGGSTAFPASAGTDSQQPLIPDFLWHDAEAYGFRGELWTCARVVKVIQEEFGVAYSKSQVSRLLKALGWTSQVPITRAIQRDEQVIERWRAEAWPELKRRAQRERRTLVYEDEAGSHSCREGLRPMLPQD